MDSLVNMAASGPPPAGHESRHLWSDGGITWQSEGAISALQCGEPPLGFCIVGSARDIILLA